jgi:hypothetical protein
MSIDDNTWYAINQTRIMTEPQQVLATFGVTRVRYYIVSEVMDQVGKVKVHEGVITSEKPSIIVPSHFAQEILSGFGEAAREYADYLTKHGDLIKILQYGLQVRKEETKEEIVSGSLAEVLGRVMDVAAASREMSTVIQGVDNMWEISLMKFMQNFIERSAGKNFQELQDHHQMSHEQEALKVLQEVEEEFYQARGDKSKISDLGKKLQDMGLYNKYEDRFYALLRECD